MKVKKTPMRRCVGCMESKPKRELIRIAGHEGRIAIDPTGKGKGRGAYVCPDAECFAKAVKKKAFSRSIGIEAPKERMEQLAGELLEYVKNDFPGASAKETDEAGTSEKEVF